MTPADARRIADDIRAICSPNNAPPEIEEFLRMAIGAAEGRPRIVTKPISRDDDEACREVFDRVFDNTISTISGPSYMASIYLDTDGWKNYIQYVADGHIIVELAEFGFGSRNELSPDHDRERRRLHVGATSLGIGEMELYASWRWRDDSEKYERRAKIQRRMPDGDVAAPTTGTAS